MGIEIRGRVQEGQGQARAFTQLDWVRKAFRDRIGFDPYPGTLNLRVESAQVRAALTEARGISIVPPSADYCAARAFPALVSGRLRTAWILPEVVGYPEDMVELMAPVSLRDALGLETGDEVIVRIGDVDDPARVDLGED